MYVEQYLSQSCSFNIRDNIRILMSLVLLALLIASFQGVAVGQGVDLDYKTLCEGQGAFEGILFACFQSSDGPVLATLEGDRDTVFASSPNNPSSMINILRFFNKFLMLRGYATSDSTY